MPTASPAWTRDAFEAVTEANRAALLAHCLRMLGSIDDAEDAVQDAFARAWRSRDTFREDVSARAWLYRIATNACLDMLERRRRGPGQPIVTSIEPVPAALFADVSAEPHARYDVAESVSMAFLAALQLLTPAQRAVLILRDVLGWRAAEVATLLELSVPATNSALHRAREAVAHAQPDRPDQPDRPRARSGGIRTLLDRYVRAWETADIPGLVALLREDATVTMPPDVLIEGAAAIRQFLEDVVFADERRIRLQPIDTNDGLGYLLSSSSRTHPDFGPYAVLLVDLDPRGTAVASMRVYADPQVVARFASC